ncbi:MULTISPECIES: hypothetical protein [Microbacterium]|nr:hypothetical protein [Microbacterium resistens]
MTGAVVAGVLALSWIAFGFWAAVLVAAALLLGAGIGRMVEGRLDPRALMDVFRGRRSSS